jgi:ribosomal protein L11 methyltransferase
MDRLSKSSYDMVLVNIVADVIIGLAPVLPKFMNENTDLICSGILCDRLDEVVAAIEKAGLSVTSVRCGEEWRCITVKKEN